MLIALDVGNSSINIGIYDLDKLGVSVDNFQSYAKSLAPCVKFKLSTSDTRCADEYAVLIHGMLSMNNISPLCIDGAIICSVVPQLTAVIIDAVKKITDIFIMSVGPGTKTGLDIKIDDPSQLGADIVANTVAVQSMFEPPFIIVDFGTATTITAVDKNNSLRGIIIMPGIRLSLNALAEKTALLTYVPIGKNPPILGKNSQDSIKSGIINSTSIAIDGFIDIIEKDFDCENINSVATGGLAECIMNSCRRKLIYMQNLTLTGLVRLYLMNNKHRKKH